MVEGVIQDVVGVPPPIRSVVVYACDGEAKATQEDSEPVWSFVGAGEQKEYMP